MPEQENGKMDEVAQAWKTMIFRDANTPAKKKRAKMAFDYYLAIRAGKVPPEEVEKVLLEGMRLAGMRAKRELAIKQKRKLARINQAHRK